MNPSDKEPNPDDQEVHSDQDLPADNRAEQKDGAPSGKEKVPRSEGLGRTGPRSISSKTVAGDEHSESVGRDKNITYVFQSSHATMPQEALRDPTRPLELDPEPLLAMKVETLCRCDELDHSRLLVITTPLHDEFLREAGRNLIRCNIDRHPGRSARYMILSGEDFSGLDIAARKPRLIGASDPEQEDGGQNAAVLISFIGAVALDVSVFNSLRRLAGYSEAPGLVFVVAIPAPLLTGKTLEGQLRQVRVWNLHSPEAILRAAAPSEADAAKFRSLLAEAQKKQLWPTVSDDLAEEMARYLTSGGWPGLLDAVIDEARPTVRVPTDEARQLYKGTGRLGKTVLIAASWFPGLVLGQFESLLRHALDQDRMEPMPPPAPVLDKDGRPSASPPPPDPPLAIDFWLESCTNVADDLRLCLPEAESLEETPAAITFTDQRLQAAMRKIVPAVDLRKLLKRLHDAGLLFNPATPEQLADALINATLPMFRGFEDEYNHLWLERQVDGLAGHREVADALHQLGESADSQGRRALELLETHHRQWFNTLMHRLARLCIGLFNAGRGEIVDRFLHRIEKSPWIEALLWRMADATVVDSSFDMFRWARHLLDSGDKNMRQRIVGLLASMGDVKPRDLWRILLRMQQWHPPEDWPEDKDLSGSQLWSLCFIYALFLGDKSNAESSVRGRQMAQLPLLFQQGEGAPCWLRRVRVLSRWLAHPALPRALRRTLKETVYEPHWDYHEAGHGGPMSIVRDVVGGAKKAPDEKWLPHACIAQMLEGWQQQVLAVTLQPVERRVAQVRELRGEARSAAERDLAKAREAHETALERNPATVLAAAVGWNLRRREAAPGKPGGHQDRHSPKTLRRAIRWLGTLWSDHSRLVAGDACHMWRSRRNAAFQLADIVSPGAEDTEP